MRANIFLALAVLAIALVPSASATTVVVAGAASTEVYASFDGRTCANYEAATMQGTWVSTSSQTLQVANADLSISIQNGGLSWTQTGQSWPCGSETMPVISASFDCAHGTGRIDAGVAGTLGVTLIITGGLVCQ